MMAAIRTILRETLALFVDDGIFAAAILVWLVVVAGVAALGPAGPVAAGPLLFVGLAVILVLGARRRARRGR